LRGQQLQEQRCPVRILASLTDPAVLDRILTAH
jgi:hypothetical protein